MLFKVRLWLGGTNQDYRHSCQSGKCLERVVVVRLVPVKKSTVVCHEDLIVACCMLMIDPGTSFEVENK